MNTLDDRIVEKIFCYEFTTHAEVNHGKYILGSNFLTLCNDTTGIFSTIIDKWSDSNTLLNTGVDPAKFSLNIVGFFFINQ